VPIRAPINIQNKFLKCNRCPQKISAFSKFFLRFFLNSPDRDDVPIAQDEAFFCDHRSRSGILGMKYEKIRSPERAMYSAFQG
jgi:hypothetical protein